jgi:protein-tyrosine phosphatase
MRRAAAAAQIGVLLLALAELSCGGRGTQPRAAAAQRSVLFICTGNYYRSRFAEALFDSRARERGLGWTAFSRGIRASRRDPDRISPHAVRELGRLGVPVAQPPSWPEQLTEQDLRRASLVVVLDRAEHEPMLRAAFPSADLSRVVFWDVKDTNLMRPAVALPLITKRVSELLLQLK